MHKTNSLAYIFIFQYFVTLGCTSQYERKDLHYFRFIATFKPVYLTFIHITQKYIFLNVKESEWVTWLTK